MPRSARKIVGGYVYHLLNRANGRLRLFRKEADFAAFETIVAQAHERVPLRILAYVVMGNHWHFVVWPRRGQGRTCLRIFSLAVDHARPAVARAPCDRRDGARLPGPLQVVSRRHRPTPARRAALRGTQSLAPQLVERAEDWRWGSLHRRLAGSPEERALLCESPVPLPRRWVEYVNRPQSEAETAAIQQSLLRGRPMALTHGSKKWPSSWHWNTLSGREVGQRIRVARSTSHPSRKPKKVYVPFIYSNQHPTLCHYR